MAAQAASAPAGARHNRMVWQNGTATEDVVVEVPLVHADLPYTVPDKLAGTSIPVYARMIWEVKQASPRPWLLYLQGGPGFPCGKKQSPWITEMLPHFNVVLMDQRGTGRSSPLTHIRLQQWVTKWGAPAVAQVLTCFRADSIVRDAEALRVALMGPTSTWYILGQSFGGFCATHYLSYIARRAGHASLAGVFITGGLPALPHSPTAADEVYKATFANISARSAAYFKAYPGDVQRVAALQSAVTSAPHGGSAGSHPLTDSRYITLPGGTRFTMRLLSSCGQALGLAGGASTLHLLIREAFEAVTAAPAKPDALHLLDSDDTPPTIGEGACQLESVFLEHNSEFETLLGGANGFLRAPLYWLLHEAIYAQGSGATDWAAQRVVQDGMVPGAPWQWLGEMPFPWLGEDVPALAPLKPVADMLAAKTDWPPLYNSEALGRNAVPVAAVVYTTDAFVPLEASMSTAAAIKGAVVSPQPECEHNGLAASPKIIVPALLQALADSKAALGVQ